MEAMVEMYGPAFDENGGATGDMVNRDVAPQDVHAYEAVGYRKGKLPEATKKSK